jgi:hypothetical protein
MTRRTQLVLMRAACAGIAKARSSSPDRAPPTLTWLLRLRAPRHRHAERFTHARHTPCEAKHEVADVTVVERVEALVVEQPFQGA